MSASHDVNACSGPSAEGEARPIVVDCNLLARSSTCVPWEAVADLRRQPGPAFNEPLPPTFLKHADEQTVVGLTAVHQAIHDGQMRGNFHDWGILAAPRYLGRSAMCVALPRFVAEGAWGVSPHVIPHRSLHAVSGTLSQALKIHGPNFGVGGGPGGEAELLLTAAALLHRQRLPGVWVVWTRLMPEGPLSPAGAPPAGSSVEALALALAPARAEEAGHRLRLSVEAQPRARQAPPDRPPPFGLGALLEGLRRLSAGAAHVTVSLGWGARLELIHRAVGVADLDGPVLMPSPGLAPAVRRRSA